MTETKKPSGVGVVLSFCVAGLLLSLSPHINQADGILLPLVISVLIGAGLALWSWFQASSHGRAPHVEWHPRKEHGFQAIAHLCVYTYWGLYHTPVQDQAWLIVAQIPLAYLLDMASSWRRHSAYRLGFGPLPIVGSINLFLWINDEWFILQFLMIGLAYGAREFLTWERDGRRRHIFNPSAFALVAVALVLLISDQTSIARGQEIASSLGKGPLCFDSILIAGLVVQLLFPVVWTTLGAFIAVMLFGLVYTGLTGGVYFIDTAIPIAVFLGMVLLITDPATSPKSSGGRFVFGACYGLSVCVLYSLLWWFSDLPWQSDETYFDKLLAVPLLNLMVPWVDRFWPPRESAERTDSGLRKWAPLALWVGLFVLARPSLVDNPGRDVDFWQQACEQDAQHCDRLAISWQTRCAAAPLLQSSQVCQAAARRVLSSGCDANNADACHGLGQLLLVDPKKPGDRNRGETLVTQGCHAGKVHLCTFLGEHLWRSKSPSLSLQRRMLIRGCQSNDAYACELLGLSSYERAQTTDEFGFARDAFEQACQSKRQLSCASYAELLITGKGGRRKGIDGYNDQKKARRVLKRTCATGFQRACDRLKTLPKLGPPPSSQPSRPHAPPGMTLPKGMTIPGRPPR